MEEEIHGIVIIGGGICGLATALALRRKGLSSLVLEKSDTAFRWSGHWCSRQRMASPGTTWPCN
ncbi:hypothetical protein GQ55_4G227900 [Panicum hallii var. hallii]|uniref:FAD dependent oxidoreductase domain-containing protein n=1 Tax=Panicum hallii var. hallii TaxID=1504633 RepID=A0A2T7DZG0_9POAL|nr:hypothetical protein GQ55_4G227900 [Panicum hallii var. hallii]